MTHNRTKQQNALLCSHPLLLAYDPRSLLHSRTWEEVEEYKILLVSRLLLEESKR